MAKGDGSIIEKERGVFEVQVSLGRDPVTGKYRRKSRTVRGTKADARKVRDQIRRELEGGLRPEGDKVTFSQFAETYTEARRAAARAGVRRIEQDKARLDFVSGILGDPPLCKVGPQTIEALYPAIRKKREAEGRRCGNTTLRGYHVLLKAFFKKAVDYDLITRNPCDRVEAPKADKPKRRSLSRKEAARLLHCIDKAEAAALADLAAKESRQVAWGVAEDRSYLLGMEKVGYPLAVRLALATGMRLGEVLGLPWGAVDFRRGTVTVRQSLGQDGVPKPPKTEAGARTVAVDAATMEHLGAWQGIQAELLETLCIDVDAAAPVLCSATGGWLIHANFERWWRGFREENEFPGLRFHELRHTQATQLLANGVDVKTVQTRLGHSDASLTLNWYAHAVPENDRAAADLVAGLFREEPEPCRIIELPKTA